MADSEKEVAGTAGWIKQKLFTRQTAGASAVYSWQAELPLGLVARCYSYRSRQTG